MTASVSHPHRGPSLRPLDQAPQEKSAWPFALSTSGAAAVHLCVLILAWVVPPPAVTASVMTQVVEIEMPKPLPQVPAPPAPPIEAETPPPTAKALSRPLARAAVPSAPRAAAQAGAVLSASDDAIDFTDEIVTGDAASYAGGATASDGTSKVAVRDVGGSLQGKESHVVNRSRAPELAQGGQWDCPFPQEADEAGVDLAVVTLEVDVDASGHVVSATALDDPGHGFGREAVLCAYEKRWAPGLNPDGTARRSSAQLRVRFVR